MIVSLLPLLAACGPDLEVMDPLRYAELAREAAEAFDGREFANVFVVAARFTEASDAGRSVDVGDGRFYRRWAPSAAVREGLVQSGFRLCRSEMGATCAEWVAEAEGVVLALGIPEHLGGPNYRLPFAWAARREGRYVHSGAGVVDVQRRESNGTRWIRLTQQLLWLDH